MIKPISCFSLIAGAALSQQVSANSSAGIIWKTDDALQKTITRTMAGNHDGGAHRSLVWKIVRTTGCDQSVLDIAANSLDTVRVHGCQTEIAQWDEAGLLELSFLTVFRDRYDTFLGAWVPNGITAQSAVYTPTNEICEVFATCGGQVQNFQYDCSNTAYCGEHATKDCDGNYQSKPCSNNSPPQQLASLGRTNCRSVQVAAQDDNANTCTNVSACSPFGVAELNGVAGWSFNCNPICLGCTGDGKCVTTTETVLQDEATTFGLRNCVEDNQGNLFCVTRRLGPQVLVTDASAGLFGALVHSFFDCVASTNGNECACNPCNAPNLLGQGQTFPVQVTCSDGTALDQCAGTTSGLPSLLNELDASQTCPHLVNNDAGPAPNDEDEQTTANNDPAGSGSTAASVCLAVIIAIASVVYAS